MPRKTQRRQRQRRHRDGRGGHQQRHHDPQAERGGRHRHQAPKMSGGQRPDRGERDTFDHRLAHVAQTVAVCAVRWRAASRRKRDRDGDQPRRPRPSSPAARAARPRWSINVTSIARRRHWRRAGTGRAGCPHCSCAARIGAPIGRVGRIVQAEQRTRIDPRLGELGGWFGAHTTGNSREVVSGRLGSRRVGAFLSRNLHGDYAA